LLGDGRAGRAAHLGGACALPQHGRPKLRPLRGAPGLPHAESGRHAGPFRLDRRRGQSRSSAHLRGDRGSDRPGQLETADGPQRADAITVRCCRPPRETWRRTRWSAPPPPR
jgi:hypothetical protein